MQQKHYTFDLLIRISNPDYKITYFLTYFESYQNPEYLFVAPHHPALMMQSVSTFFCLQFDQMSVQASQYGDELRVVKGEVAEVNRLISRLQSEIEAVKAQVQIQEIFSLVECNSLDDSDPTRVISPPQRGSLENQLGEAEERGELAVKEAKARTRDLEDALQRAKQDMARQLREYQVRKSRINDGSMFSFIVSLQYRIVQLELNNNIFKYLN